MTAHKHAISALALCGLAALLLGHSPAQAQVVAKMTGKVVDEEGNPLKGVKVYVKDVRTNNVVRPAVTSSKGRFTYTSLPPATYIIWCELDGYMMAKLLARLTGGDGSVSERDFYYDDKQEFKDEIHVNATGGSLTLVKNEFEIIMTTPDKHTAVVNRLYAESRGGGEEAGEEGKPAAPEPVKTEKSNLIKAEEMIAAGNNAAAIPFLRLAIDEIEDQGELTEANYMLGKAALETGDLDTAQASLLKAQGLDPTKVGVAFHLARVYNEKGMKAEATAELEKELALSPDSEAVRENLAGFYAQTGDTGKAIEAYEAIIESNPENFAAYQQLAALYKSAGQRDKEAEVYARMGDKDPTGQSLYNLGNLAFNEDDKEKAKFYYERVIDKNPKHAMAHYQLGYTLLGLGDIQGAVEHLESFAKLRPKDPKAEEAKSTAAALKEMLKG